LKCVVRQTTTRTFPKKKFKNGLDEYYTMDISISKGQLVATVKQKHAIENNWRKAVNVSFRAYPPINVTTDLETSGGSVALSNLNGEHEFTQAVEVFLSIM
jgi:hypothetical protein